MLVYLCGCMHIHISVPSVVFGSSVVLVCICVSFRVFFEMCFVLKLHQWSIAAAAAPASASKEYKLFFRFSNDEQYLL